VILGAVFLFSGALKIRDSSWHSAARQFGAPKFVAIAIAPIEIILGAMLVVGVGTPWTSIGAEVLLAMFTIAMLRVMRRPVSQRPICACFGRWTSRPVGTSSVLRNLVLLALAAISSGA
ncbi:MAG: MauE/DoxX family redox-associated membrane protein, partial [Acidimicrobiales bacterium]